MAGIFANGTILSISKELEQPVTVTDISNGAEAVATITGGTLSDGDIVIVQSGWSQLTNQIRRVKAASADQVTLEGADTTDLVIFPAGSGGGSLIKVKNWTQLSQISESSTSGGDQNFYQWQWLEDRNSMQRQRPTFKNAMAINITLDYDDSLLWYQALIDADTKAQPIVLWAHLPHGADLYYYVYPSFNPEPTLTMNENSKVSGTFSLMGLSTRYKGA